MSLCVNRFIYCGMIFILRVLLSPCLCAPVDAEDDPVATTEFATLPPIHLTDLGISAADENALTKETEGDLSGWEAPDWIRKNYPMYLSGYDYEGRPIWVAEWGKFDMKKIAEGGPEVLKNYTKYVAKTVQIINNYTLSDANPSHEANFIFDFEGLPLEQVASIPTMTYVFELGQSYRQFLESKHVARVIVLNANYATDLFLRLARSLFGKFFERVEVFGNNREKWIPQLLRIFPKDQLPEWYGGEKDHKPVLIYG